MRFFNEIFLLPSEADKIIFQYYPNFSISSLIPNTKRKLVVHIKSLGTQELEAETPAVLFRQDLIFNGYLHNGDCNCADCKAAIQRFTPDYTIQGFKMDSGKIFTKPYTLGNVDRLGKICWGPRQRGAPPNMRHAHSFFWSSPFNMDHWKPWRDHNNGNPCPTLKHDCRGGCPAHHQCIKRRSAKTGVDYCQPTQHRMSCTYHPTNPNNPLHAWKRESNEREKFNLMARHLAHELGKKEGEAAAVQSNDRRSAGDMLGQEQRLAPEPQTREQNELLFKAVSMMVLEVGLPLPGIPKPQPEEVKPNVNTCGCQPDCICCQGRCRCQTLCKCCLRTCGHVCACKLEERFLTHLKTYLPDKDANHLWADETKLIFGDRYVASPKHADAVFVSTEKEVLDQVPEKYWRNMAHDEEAARLAVIGFANRADEGWEVRVEDHTFFLEEAKAKICTYLHRDEVVLQGEDAPRNPRPRNR